ncbi:hypothetical protein ANO11243_037830 [Dothideomycetidae sp. 11243]|nr:hypothetical protein ANO11243_037830 [fungal sp. No.11243]
MMWFCEPCDRQLGSEDTSYMRGWSWRRRYSHIGVGIGEGEQGVICGREGQCLAMSCLEVEVEIDSEQFDHPNDVADTSARSWSNTGYLTQEIEGIGGVVKKKVKKRVPVGHVVKEYEDERMSGGYLHREQTGKVRSWCAHCNKVILGEKDKNTAVEDPSGHIRTNSNSSSSTGSSMLMAWQ